MSSKEFFADLTDTAPVLREISLNGKTKSVYFRKITAGETLAVNKSIRFKRVGEDMVADATIEDIFNRNALMIQCCVVDENGSRIFKKLSEVQELDDRLFHVLQKEADAVNKFSKEENDEGKS